MGVRPRPTASMGYKGHIAVDPDSEVITATVVKRRQHR